MTTSKKILSLVINEASFKERKELNQPMSSISFIPDIQEKFKESYLFIIIDGATLMTLEYIFPAIGTDSRIGWY